MNLKLEFMIFRWPQQSLAHYLRSLEVSISCNLEDIKISIKLSVAPRNPLNNGRSFHNSSYILIPHEYQLKIMVWDKTRLKNLTHLNNIIQANHLYRDYIVADSKYLAVNPRAHYSLITKHFSRFCSVQMLLSLIR